MIHGIDISSGTFNYGAIAAAEAFVYIKVTDGVGSPNPRLMAHANALRGGPLLGGYHFLRVRHGMRQDADEQCKQFMDGCANAGLTMPPELDVELGEPGSSNRAATKDEVRAAVELFLETYFASWSTKPVGYSSPGEMGAMGLTAVDAFTALPLSLAKYILPPGQAPASPPTAGPSLPMPYTAWTFWQYAGDVQRYGGVVDLNVFNGTLEQLQALAP